VTTAAEILADARAADDANAGIVNLLVNDPDLERLVAVWANVPLPPDPEPDEECPPDLPVWARLRWVWSRLEPDPIPVWIGLAGLPDAPHIRRAVSLAVDNRIVLPDGTLSSWALVYVQQQARRTLGIRPERNEPAPASTPPTPEPAPRPAPYEDDGMIRPGRRLRGGTDGV
jgi:hypothetical protein